MTKNIAEVHALATAIFDKIAPHLVEGLTKSKLIYEIENVIKKTQHAAAQTASQTASQKAPNQSAPVNKADFQPTGMLKLVQELQSLTQQIEALKVDLSQMRQVGTPAEAISGATDELTAVVTETEGATNIIMNACDQVSEALMNAPIDKLKDVVGTAITSVYEACSFQDITGQRIKKVIRTLQKVEIKIKELTVAMGGNVATVDVNANENPLLNGPALPLHAANQDDIDKLF